MEQMVLREEVSELGIRDFVYSKIKKIKRGGARRQFVFHDVKNIGQTYRGTITYIKKLRTRMDDIALLFQKPSFVKSIN